MKSCYWCELADELCEHPDDEVGGIDADTDLWICDGCVESAWEISGLTTLAPDSLKAGDSSLPESVKVENALPAESG